MKISEFVDCKHTHSSLDYIASWFTSKQQQQQNNANLNELCVRSIRSRFENVSFCKQQNKIKTDGSFRWGTRGE